MYFEFRYVLGIERTGVKYILIVSNAVLFISFVTGSWLVSVVLTCIGIAVGVSYPIYSWLKEKQR
jgi:hypothetical protein